MKILIIFLFCQFSFAQLITAKNQDLKTKIEKSLLLLKTKASKEYLFTIDNTLYITQAKRSGARVNAREIQIAPKSCPTVIWCASVIFHESIHLNQYRNNQDHSGDKAESIANILQLALLKKLKAHPSYIKHLQKIINSGIDHSDLNGDGVYDIEDYKLRDW